MADIFIPRHPGRIEQFTFPTVTQWNRVEGRPRTVEFDRSLRAEVRDGLWMLTRQWQLGEFRGDDAGAPVHAHMRLDHTRLTRAKLGEDPPQQMTGPLPLETRVERLRMAFVRDDRKIGLDLRLLLGRQWLSMIDGIGSYADAYLAAYRLEAPDPADLDPDVQGLAHPASYAMLSALDGLVVDGGDLYLHLLEPGAAASDGITLTQPGHGQLLDDQGEAFVAWFDRLISQPDDGHDGAWTPDRLEYQFDASAPSSATAANVYRAAEYAGGSLDWWSIDVDDERTSLDELNSEPEDDTVLGFEVRIVVPSPVQFDGMPNPRCWAFEDGRVNLGTVSAATTDLAKLLFLEFGLLYSNDWFVVPFTAPAATVATITGCVVTNTFGEHFWVAPAAKGRDDDPHRFTLFTSSVIGDARKPAETGLMLLPTAPAVLEGPAREEVLFLRDEVANMVWGVECAIPLPSGESQRGIEAARQTRAFFEAQLAARLAGPGAPPPHHVPPPAVAPIRYLDPVHSGARAGRQPHDPAAARRPAPNPRRRSRSARQGAAAYRAIASGPRPHPGPDLLRLRGGGVARRHASDAGVRAHALDQRPRLYLVACAPADRSRRGLERAGLRQADQCSGGAVNRVPSRLPTPSRGLMLSLRRPLADGVSAHGDRYDSHFSRSALSLAVCGSVIRHCWQLTVQQLESEQKHCGQPE
jgi:hypothetical protein